MKRYLEISISASAEQRELLIPTMMEIGCEGFEETDTSLLCYITMDRWDEAKLQSYKKDLTAILRTISSNAEVRFREIQDRNWNEEWEKTIQPIRVSDRIVVKPSWARFEDDGNTIVIQIDPKMSFGTGYHETTRLVLRLLETHLKPGWRVLDVGTGTGLLAIASIKLGAMLALGTDIDVWALENANENVLANGVGDKIQILDTPVNTIPPASFELITANLTLNTNIELMEDFHRALAKGGILLLSGLLRNDRDAMVEGLQRHQFRLIEERYENEWVAIAASRE